MRWDERNDVSKKRRVTARRDRVRRHTTHQGRGSTYHEGAADRQLVGEHTEACRESCGLATASTRTIRGRRKECVGPARLTQARHCHKV